MSRECRNCGRTAAVWLDDFRPDWSIGLCKHCYEDERAKRAHDDLKASIDEMNRRIAHVDLPRRIKLIRAALIGLEASEAIAVLADVAGDLMAPEVAETEPTPDKPPEDVNLMHDDSPF